MIDIEPKKPKVHNNTFLMEAKKLGPDEFTTEEGIKNRKKCYKVLNSIIKRANGKKCILVSYPELDPDENYIFAAGHSFPGDIGSNLSVIDRNVYTLVGTTDQVDHNPQMKFLWLNGLIYVNKLDQLSRKDSYNKMVRVLNLTSVMLFPEGVLNNTENLNCEHLYPGVYFLSLETGKKVIPIVANYNKEENVVLIAAGNPISFEGKTKEEGIRELRDMLATLRFDLSRMTTEQALSLGRVLTPDEFLKINPEVKVEMERSSLKGDIHLQHLKYREEIYKEVTWTSTECWDEEITPYIPKNIVNYEDAFSFIHNIDFDKIKPEYYVFLRQILEEVERREAYKQKYDIKDYMKKNWNRNPPKEGIKRYIKSFKTYLY